MIVVRAVEDVGTLQAMRAEYLAGLAAPLDGMWDTGFIGPAPHYGLWSGDELVGYCVADEAHGLMQFFLAEPVRGRAGQCLDAVVHTLGARRGLVFSMDPTFAALCRERDAAFETHSLLYRVAAPAPGARSEAGLVFRPVEASELGRAVGFQRECLDGGPELTDWLTGYSGGLIERGELFVLAEADRWIGLGEHRVSETQEGVVDLGMMVAPPARGRGWATDILARLRALADSAGLTAICSTTVANIGAQKAIERAGFEAGHRLFTVSFD